MARYQLKRDSNAFLTMSRIQPGNGERCPTRKAKRLLRREMSPSGPTRTSCDVRILVAIRCKADVRRSGGSSICLHFRTPAARGATFGSSRRRGQRALRLFRNLSLYELRMHTVTNSPAGEGNRLKIHTFSFTCFAKGPHWFEAGRPISPTLDATSKDNFGYRFQRHGRRAALIAHLKTAHDPKADGHSRNLVFITATS
jgi:hypothetical protein